jgi:Glycosyltransferase family 87
MNRARALMRNGDWLTLERIWLVTVALVIASIFGFLFLVVTAHGGIDRQGRPIGTDFSNVYAAGTYVLDGTPDAPFDPPQQYHREQAIFGATTPFYGWHYPPYFLFVAGALAKLPYGLALTVWQSATLALYLLMIWAIVGRGLSPAAARAPGEGRGEVMAPPGLASRYRRDTLLWLLLALAFPGVLINVGHGQNGFLTAALLGGALVLLDRRPLLAGVLIGLLIYKPQFGLLIPIALACGARWRAFTAAAVTVAVLTLVVTLAFGPQVWHAFLVSTQYSRTVVLEQGDAGWYKMQSMFAWARMWGASIPLAYALQAVLTIAVAGIIGRLWRSETSYALKSAALCLGTVLATPYTFDYDMMLLAPAIAFFAVDGLTRGFLSWEKTAFAALWLVPLVARTVTHVTLVPLGVPAMLAALVVLVRRTELGRCQPERHSPMALARASATMAEAAGGARGHDIAAFE